MRHKLHLKLLTARFTALMYWETSGVIRLLTAFQVVPTLPFLTGAKWSWIIAKLGILLMILI